MIDSAVEAQPKASAEPDDVNAEVSTFISERLRRYFLDRDSDLTTEIFDAVLARDPHSLVDFERRLEAVQTFIALEPAASLASANKRIANILKKAEQPHGTAVKEKLLTDPAELALWAALRGAKESVAPLMEAREYTAALTALAGLREPVDQFFDAVMVMVDDKATRDNRLALLGELRALFLDVADISRLSV
jgi:glycyl-tRNA synthetase beta chain